ncbi:MAG: methyltransferase domain-containing protein [Defluviitaleaceae bacterium]|nr:methyltransferase domain-containing protein [Defluviitaleaceae bacterium]
MLEEIRNLYENYDEKGRLFKDNAHKTEYLTTVRYFDRIFKPGSHILDVCAGAGSYSFYLAGQGHIVTAGDLLQHHVDIMKTSPAASKLADIIACDVMDLSRFADGSFDVVLCMGALYHYRNDNDKRRAVAECVRVCKPGGVVALAYLTEIGCLYMELNDDASNINELLKYRSGELEAVFTATTSETVDEIARNSGLEMLHNIGTDGLIYAAKHKLNSASNEDFDRYMEFHYTICEAPDVVGATLHGLWMGRKI